MDESDEISTAIDLNPRYLRHLNFESNHLPRPRDISVYLPPQYLSEPDRRFPVFYLHDGQNLIDPRLSYVPGNTWRIDETADLLAESGEIEPVILVGIANTGLGRLAEYTHARDYKMGGGDGRKYGRLITDELKPFIDNTYRTQPNHTAIGGSSLGGLISLYLGLENRSVFSKIAVLSPSLWWNHKSIFSIVNEAAPTPPLKIYLDMGTNEGPRHLRDADQLFKLLKTRGWKDGVDLSYTRAEGGTHSETAWAHRFPDVLRFLFPNP